MLTSDLQDYNNGLYLPVKGATTRGIVVSNVDPLFMGRVKVWIPAIHGVLPADLLDNVDIEGGSNTSRTLPKGVSVMQSWDDDSGKRLPWAKVMSATWGPRVADDGDVKLSGIFGSPKKGTEVFIIFENNDPTLPIVIGCVIHANEFVYTRNRPLEIYPGENVVSTFTGESDYNDNVSQSITIGGEGGSIMQISDTPGNSSLLLSSNILLSDIDTMSKERFDNVKKVYPGFPTTASAAFASREILSTNSLALVANASSPATAVSVLPVATGPATPGIKMWPVKPKVGTVPRLSGNPKTGNFGEYREGYKSKEKTHCGIDIGATVTDDVVAPIELTPLYYHLDNSNGTGTGNQITALASDGTGHAFFHLSSINPTIIDIIRNKPGTKIPAGSVLGKCGNTGHSFGVHLHWEIFKNASSGTTGASLNAIRLSRQGVGASQYINPVSWLGNNYSTTVIQGSIEQLKSMDIHSTAFADINANDEKFKKPIGLEVCTIPGQEFIYLRHPSGSFIGIDCDGNIQGFSSGDVNWRVNRSWNLDVLGGILEVCYAKFSRIRTVVKQWSKSAKLYESDKSKVTDAFPDFFKRAEANRDLDMLNAVKSDKRNSFYVRSDGTTTSVNTASATQFKNITTPPTDIPRDLKNTSFDSILQQKYKQYITSPDLLLVFPDWRWFKAQMLWESNGKPDAIGGNSSQRTYGLFQISEDVVKTIKGSNIGDMSEYMSPEKNIDIGIQYIISNYYSVLKAIKLTNASGILSDLAGCKDDIRYITTLGYNIGPTAVGQCVKSLTDTSISYQQVEAKYKESHSSGRSLDIHLGYVPSIVLQYSKLTQNTGN